jgi:hypothetical protein
MYKANLFFILFLFLSAPCFAQSNTTETLTITTYYPAPYGVYRNLKLNPTDETPSGSALSPGVMYFNRSTDSLQIYTNNSGWCNITGGNNGEFDRLKLNPIDDAPNGANLSRGVMYYNNSLNIPAIYTNTGWSNLTNGGNSSACYWVKDAANNIYNNNTGGRVGIGTTSPRSKFQVVNAGSLPIDNHLDFSILLCDCGNAADSLGIGTDTDIVYFNAYTGYDFFIRGGNNPILDMDTSAVTIGTAARNINLHVNGDITATGSITPPSSDIRMKKNIKPLSDVIRKLAMVNPVKFDWRVEEFKDRQFPRTRQIGLIAQEVEKEFPELVRTDKEGYKSLDYDKFTAVLLGAIKEQQSQIESLKKEIESIKTRK